MIVSFNSWIGLCPCIALTLCAEVAIVGCSFEQGRASFLAHIKRPAATALENLRAEVVQIEALVRATEAAADSLPAPTTDLQRLVFGRVQALATKASEQASASLRFAKTQVAALTAQMEARRKAAVR